MISAEDSPTGYGPAFSGATYQTLLDWNRQDAAQPGWAADFESLDLTPPCCAFATPSADESKNCGCGHHQALYGLSKRLLMKRYGPAETQIEIERWAASTFPRDRLEAELERRALADPAMARAEATEGQGRVLRQGGPLVLIVAGVLLVLGAVGWPAFSARLANPGEAAVPDVIAGLPLQEKTVGVEAVAEVRRLHGKELPLTSGALATYGRNGEVRLWVTGAPAGTIAAEMVQAMTDKIAEGRSPFTATGVRRASGRAVHELVGMGQRHFYFQTGSLVIWLAADERLADRAIDEVVKFYR